MSELHIGTVFHFDRQKCFGFIDVEGRDQQDDKRRVFFHQDKVIRDCVGRRFLDPGTRVSFHIIFTEKGERAVEVRNLTAEPDPETYFEDSTVFSWDAKRRIGYLMRPEGSTIYLHGSDITTIGEEDLHPGKWVRHRIARDRSNTNSGWRATDISIYDYDPEPEQTVEEYFDSLPDSPADVPEPEPVAAPQSVLSPATRNLTLLEIRQAERNSK
jgi:cold shock CspA family protein